MLPEYSPIAHILTGMIAAYGEQRLGERRRALSYTPAYCLGLSLAAFLAPPVALSRSKRNAVFSTNDRKSASESASIVPSLSADNIHLGKSNMICLLLGLPPDFPHSYLLC